MTLKLVTVESPPYVAPGKWVSIHPLVVQSPGVDPLPAASGQSERVPQPPEPTKVWPVPTVIVNVPLNVPETPSFRVFPLSGPALHAPGLEAEPDCPFPRLMNFPFRNFCWTVQVPSLFCGKTVNWRLNRSTAQLAPQVPESGVVEA